MRAMRLLLLPILLALGLNSAVAQDYPAKPIRVVVAYPAGGAADLIVRSVFNQLSERSGYHVVVENKGGGGTQIAAEVVRKSPPDGYTLFATGMETFAINPFIHSKLSYDPANDFVPVTGLGYAHQILAVPASSEIKSVQDLIARAKAAKGELQYGTIGVGGSAHINMVLFEQLAGVNLTPIHYRGGAPMLTDLVAGHIPMGFLSVTLLHEWIAAGKLRGLAVGSKSRIPQLPDVPTVDESGVKGYEAVSWFGLFAPKATPDGIVRKLNTDIQSVFADAEYKKRFLAPSFLEVIPGGPDQFSAYIRKEQDKWKRVVEKANLKVD